MRAVGVIINPRLSYSLNMMKHDETHGFGAPSPGWSTPGWSTPGVAIGAAPRRILEVNGSQEVVEILERLGSAELLKVRGAVPVTDRGGGYD